jgi:hypothetical protein
VGGSEQVASEADEVLEPHGFEAQLRAEFAQFARDFVFEEVVAGDDRDRRLALGVVGAQLPQKPEPL